MSPVLKAVTRRLRWRQLARYAAYGASAVLLGIVIGVSLELAWTAQRLVALLLIGVTVTVVIDLARWRHRVTAKRVAAHLCRRYPSLDEGIELLLRRADQLAPLARLQYARSEAQLAALDASEDLAQPFAARVPAAWALGLSLVALIAQALWWLPQMIASRDGGVASRAPLIEAVQIDVRAPAYTRLAEAHFDTPDVTVLANSQLRFSLRTRGAMARLEVGLANGESLRLFDAGHGRWQSDWHAPDAQTYQFLADGAALPVAGADTVHRIAWRFDAPPVVQLTAPVSRVITVGEPVPPLTVSAEISDDFGIRAVALRVTTSAGTGEQVSFEDSSDVWLDDPDAGETSLTLTRTLDLVALGLSEASELYLHIEAADAHPDAGHVGVSPVLIIRREGSEPPHDIVVDNPLIQVMPEYFRSQRQIIIDTERLIDEAATISDDEFAARAQGLAVDQKALRLRYGTFMGEEDGGEPTAGEDGLGDGHYEGDGHEHGADFSFARESEADRFADAADATAAYSHFHDQAEQATLFDPETRGLLAQALTAMWSSERRLRQYEAAPALPHQYQALALIKRVQNRSRAYVGRVGVSITPLDPERRLTGELDDIPTDQTLASVVAEEDADIDASAVAALLASGPNAQPAAADALSRWLAQGLDEALTGNGETAAWLAAQAALKQWQNDASCRECRARLARFWRTEAPDSHALPARRQAPFNAFEGSGE